MNRVARKGFLTVMVAGGVLASAGWAQADSSAGGDGAGSPGIASGNQVLVPVHVPVHVCGNSVDVAGLLDPAQGNACATTVHHVEPPVPSPPAHKPIPAPPNEPTPAPTLAHTGAGGAGLAAGAGTALLLGGAILYRRARPAALR